MLHLFDSNYREFIAAILVCPGKAGAKASRVNKQNTPSETFVAA